MITFLNYINKVLPPAHSSREQIKRLPESTGSKKPTTKLYYLNNSPEWTTSFRWFSNSPSSPLHSQPYLLCVHKTWSWLSERFSLLSSKASKLHSLQLGQGLLSAWIRRLHELQKLVPQHVAWYGSRRIRWHIGQSVWKTLGGGSTNLQS